MKQIRKKWMHIDQIFLFCDGRFQEQRYITDTPTETSRTKDYLPFFPFTHTPVEVSIEAKEEWEMVDTVVCLPNANDWSFFELEWLLYRLDSCFSFFDFDSFYLIPSYPKDLLNEPIHPLLLLHFIEKYICKYSTMKMKINFPVLYLFFKDQLGKDILTFFYEEVIGRSSRQQLISKLHRIYHRTNDRHPFKMYLFYNSMSIINSRKSDFDIKRYITNFISFHYMFGCPNFVKYRGKQIMQGLSDTKNILL